MPPRIRNKSLEKAKEELLENPMKQNTTSNIKNTYNKLSQENNFSISIASCVNHKESALLQGKENYNLKPLRFWSKKLKELEEEKNLNKRKNIGLYEFNVSDDSYSPSKEKKKTKQKFPRKKKNVQPEIQRLYKKNVRKALVIKKSCLQLNRQIADLDNNEKVIQNNKTLSPVSKPLLSTSTPYPNKSKPLDTSNFMFLSPIKTKPDKSKQIILSTSVMHTLHIPKKEVASKEVGSNLNTGVRVLRNRKIILKN